MNIPIIRCAPALPWSRPSMTLPRSEEHTYELQSLRHLVCRLLLEKKKNVQVTGVYRTLSREKAPASSSTHHASQWESHTPVRKPTESTERDGCRVSADT